MSRIILILVLLALPLGAQLPFRFTVSGGQANDNLGQGLALGPDLDGDGRRDILAGAPGRLDAGGNALGGMDAFSSADGSLLFSLAGHNANDGFGSRVVSGFDFNGDGIEDWAVSAPRWDRGYIDVGRVYLISGADLSLLGVRDGSSFRSFFGSALAPAGDVDGDGVGDLLIGGPGASLTRLNQGEAALVSGKTGAFIRHHFGLAAQDSYGAGLAGIGDIDGDGLSDYAIGAPGVDHDVMNGGEVVIYSGASGSELRRHYGRRSFGGYGNSIVRLSDVDGDGVDDYAIAAPTNDEAGINAGRVELRSGLTGRLLVERLADSQLDRFGVSLAAGDFDGDGQDDLLIGATGDTQGGPGAGSVTVMTAGGEIVNRLDGAPYAFLGQQLVNAGDLEADGIDDFLMSSLISQGAVINAGGFSLASHLGATVTGPTATYGLALRFKPGLTVPRQGGIEVTGLPAMIGRLVFSTSAPQAFVSGVPILVNVISPTGIASLVFGPSGVTSLPLDLGQPALRGLVLHAQAFAIPGTGIQVSRRLSLLFGR